MDKNIFYFISFLKSHILQKKVYGYVLKVKNNIKFLDWLWQKNFIWGYKIFSRFLKVYFKYYLNKSSIYCFKIYDSFINVDLIEKYIQRYPQSLFILNTSNGYKCAKYCLEFNLGGKLFLQVN